MSHSTLFDIPSSAADLKMSNSGISESEVMVIPPDRSVAGETAFSGGRISYNLSLGSDKYVVPNSMVFRLRCNVTKANGDKLDGTHNIALSVNPMSNLFQSHSVNIGGHAVARTNDYVSATDTFLKRTTNSKALLESDQEYGFSSFVTREAKLRARGLQEITWKPSLDWYQISHLVPACDLSIELVPFSNGVWQPRLIETDVPLTLGVDYKVSIEDMYLVARVVTAPRLENGSKVVLDMVSARLQSEPISDTGGQKQTLFNVSPSTMGLAVVLFDGRASNETPASESRFISWNNGYDTYKHDFLREFFIEYDGQVRPHRSASSIDYDNDTNYYYLSYLSTQMNTGALNSVGGHETFTDWLENRGPIHYFSFAKNASSKATRVNVTTNFETTTELGNTRLGLIECYRRLASITYENGRATSVVIQTE